MHNTFISYKILFYVFSLNKTNRNNRSINILICRKIGSRDWINSIILE